MRKNILKLEKLNSPYYNLPVHTHDTTVRVCGLPRCAKIHYRTHTHKTRDLKPAGFPIPVTIPIYATAAGTLKGPEHHFTSQKICAEEPGYGPCLSNQWSQGRNGEFCSILNLLIKISCWF